MSLYLLISISYGSSARQNHILQIVKHFDFSLISDVIGDPEVNNTMLPRKIFRSIERRLNLQIQLVVPEF